MRGIDVALLASLIAASGGVGLLALYILARLEQRRIRPRASLVGGHQAGVVFLFDDERLVDATPAARQLLAVTQREGTAWARLSQALLNRFPGFGDRMSELVDLGEIEIPSRDGNARILAEWRDGLARISLLDGERQTVTVDRHAMAAIEGEIAILRGIVDKVPYLTWKEADDGSVTWANAAYLDLARRAEPQAEPLAWPPATLFKRNGNKRAVRRELRLPGKDTPNWFEVGDRAAGDGVLRYALPVDAIVAAEFGRAEFVQTLTKTFANLSVGLAIFDRSRRLGLFNPALTELTALPVAFLLQKPSLHDFVDRLREGRILPEPKNFESWRQRLSELEKEAEAGRFEETWTLPDGRIFRVSGHPHPDGAIAFLVADVSAEMSLTRRFRSEIQLNQSVLDTLDEAIAVFASDGTLALANAAYCRIWDCDPRQALVPVTLSQSLRDWRASSAGHADWDDLSGLLAEGRLRTPTGLVLERLNGPRLECRFVPLTGGAMLASFAEATQMALPVFRRAERRAEGTA